MQQVKIGNEIALECEGVKLWGNLHVPKGAKGIVLFAHGSGSSRKSARNQYVARVLQDENIATLLLDLLTEKEEVVDLKTNALRFDISLLTNRLIQATAWINQHKTTHHLSCGYFGASTGAAAALNAAAELGNKITAVVSRGGRPDLVVQALPKTLIAT